MSDILSALVSMTRTLGEEAREYVIIGEGNTSARIDDDAFWIKASGQQMSNIDADGFVAVRFEPILEMLESSPGDLAAQKKIMEAAKVDPNSPNTPSVEVTFHAMLLQECGISTIGHTHPVDVNRILCSSRAEQFARNRSFPDEVVLCGPESVYVPYVDPGLPLALAIRDGVRDYMNRNNEAPKVVHLGGHGMIALGNSPTEVLNIMAMTAKAAKIFMGTCAVGEPVFMTPQDISHIWKRPDEIYRRQRFV